VLYHATEFLTLGSRVLLPYLLKFENNLSIENYDSTNTFSKTTGVILQEIEYPLSLGFGLNYKFTNILLARLNFDFEYTFWSDIKDDLNPGLLFEDTYRIMVGVEHIFMDQVPFRVGFNYAPLRENKSITQTILTAGTGMVFDKFTFEISGGISSLTYNQFDIYDNALYGEESRGEEALDRVETNSFYGMLEVNYFLDF
jgi:long-subunit fatty acid transport protein